MSVKLRVKENPSNSYLIFFKLQFGTTPYDVITPVMKGWTTIRWQPPDIGPISAKFFNLGHFVSSFKGSPLVLGQFPIVRWKAEPFGFLMSYFKLSYDQKASFKRAHKMTQNHKILPILGRYREATRAMFAYY